MIIGKMSGNVLKGFSGAIKTLTFDARISVVQAPNSDNEKAPAWRILIGDPADGAEIGGGWDRLGSRGHYIALQIDDPNFAAPLRANMIQLDDDTQRYAILWSRPEPRDGR